jgi:hypothetical protein
MTNPGKSRFHIYVEIHPAEMLDFPGHLKRRMVKSEDK